MSILLIDKCEKGYLTFSVGAKSQILSSVAGRKSWLVFSVRGMSGGLRNPCFTKFSVVYFF